MVVNVGRSQGEDWSPPTSNQNLGSHKYKNIQGIGRAPIYAGLLRFRQQGRVDKVAAEK